MPVNASFLYYLHSDYGKTLDRKSLSDLLGSNDPGSARINGIGYEDYYRVPTANASFELKTTYPGLVIGAGYNHPAGESDDDLQMGFFFDHTTGMPVVPGSTVKGRLKSVFPKKGDSRVIAEEKIKYINGLLGQKSVVTMQNWEKLFEGDVFFDAYISTVPGGGRIFAEDYITPHNPGDPMGAFKNPTPLRFLKIAPGVGFTFQFRLKSAALGSGAEITEDNKKELFKKIILDFGIGGKGNVGYGNFESL